MNYCDNLCTFFEWVLRGKPVIAKLSDGTYKATLPLSSNKPNAKGIWNKNYFTAFGDQAAAIAKDVEEGKLKNGSKVTVQATQQSYMDSSEKMRQNFKILGYMVKYEPDNQSQSGTDHNSKPQEKPQPTPQPQPPVQPQPNSGNVNGYEGMMNFMNS